MNFIEVVTLDWIAEERYPWQYSAIVSYNRIVNVGRCCDKIHLCFRYSTPCVDWGGWCNRIIFWICVWMVHILAGLPAVLTVLQVKARSDSGCNISILFRICGSELLIKLQVKLCRYVKVGCNHHLPNPFVLIICRLSIEFGVLFYSWNWAIMWHRTWLQYIPYWL
jgi:hypothetical protein